MRVNGNALKGQNNLDQRQHLGLVRDCGPTPQFSKIGNGGMKD